MGVLLPCGLSCVQLGCGLHSTAIFPISVRLPIMDVHGSRPNERPWTGVQAVGCLCQDAQQNQRNRVAD